MEAEVNNAQTLLLAHQSLVGDLIAEQKRSAKKVEDLENRVQKLEEQVDVLEAYLR